MNLYIGCDHAGYTLKEEVYKQLKRTNKLGDINIVDLGCYSSESCDYPDVASLLCSKIRETGGYGILICGTGQGMAMTANKNYDIRAAVAWSPEIARLSREHNNSNVLCIGSRFLNFSEAMNCISAFLSTSFSTEPRHNRRVKKIKQNQ
jgi:ribose 5-phosphate isomerase B